uniref:Uncharacterized protein n=1 Tax=Tetranychus urticae TaxID=32264 RepID=T1JVW1_TETUR
MQWQLISTFSLSSSLPEYLQPSIYFIGLTSHPVYLHVHQHHPHHDDHHFIFLLHSLHSLTPNVTHLN